MYIYNNNTRICKNNIIIYGAIYTLVFLNGIFAFIINGMEIITRMSLVIHIYTFIHRHRRFSMNSIYIGCWVLRAHLNSFFVFIQRRSRYLSFQNGQWNCLIVFLFSYPDYNKNFRFVRTLIYFDVALSTFSVSIRKRVHSGLPETPPPVCVLMNEHEHLYIFRNGKSSNIGRKQKCRVSMSQPFIIISFI